MRRLAVNLFLVVASVAVALAGFELALRTFFPKYRYAAESPFRPDDERIWSRQPSTTITRAHPDSGIEHAIEYNNIALRQPRDVTGEDLRELTTIAFFGDSFTENLRIPTHATFTEILDYLLNARGRRYNVLNFAVDGYGTDQSYLYYLSSNEAHAARYVFYVYCANDIKDIYVNNLLTLDSSGHLQRRDAVLPTPLMALISRLYLTYFVLEARAALQALLDDEAAAFDARKPLSRLLAEETRSRWQERDRSDETARIWRATNEGDFASIGPWAKLFRAILEAWRAEAARHDARFTIVLLPVRTEERLRGYLGSELEMISLYEAFSRAVPDYQWADFRFRSDGHWEEKGNMLAAIFMFRHLEKVFGLEPMPCGELELRLRAWYAVHGAEPPLAAPPCSEERLVEGSAALPRRPDLTTPRPGRDIPPMVFR